MRDRKVMPKVPTFLQTAHTAVSLSFMIMMEAAGPTMGVMTAGGGTTPFLS